MSGIIPAGKIDVPDAPAISSMELIRQIVENIEAQISFVDVEIYTAQQRDTGLIKELYDCIHDVKTHAEGARSSITLLLNNNSSLSPSSSSSDVVSDSATIESPSKSESKSEALQALNEKLEAQSDLLQRIRDLQKALIELEHELTAGESDYYRIIAELLIGAQKQFGYFQPYGAIPQIQIMGEKLHAIESELKRQIQWSFREIGQLVLADGSDDGINDLKGANGKDLSSLQRIHLVVNALGTNFRKDLLERFAQLQLIPYEKQFACSATNKFSSLEFLDRRFAWFKKLLAVADNKLTNIIPVKWQLPKILFAEFVRRTKQHITDVLSLLEKSTTDTPSHVQMLLRGVKAVVTFEAEMKVSFAVAARGQDDADGSSPTPLSAANIGTLDGTKGAPSDNRNGSSKSVDIVEIGNSGDDCIAQAFDAFLGPYVQQERDELDKLMSKVSREEVAGTLVEDEGPRKPRDPFTSAKKLFEFVKKSLKRCTGFSNGHTYVALSREFRVAIHNYAESLKFRCPSPVAARPGKAPVYLVSNEQDAIMCSIINTAEYCTDLVPQLEAHMKKAVAPSLVDEIDLGGQLDAFQDVVAYTFAIMTSGAVERLDPIFKKMRLINWSVVDDVGDESPYVKEMKSALSDTIVRIRSATATAYFLQYCAKLTCAFCDVLFENIWKLKRISKLGGGQLLMDLNGFKEYLLRMPNKRLEVHQDQLPISQAYTMIVNTRVLPISIVLKLVAADDDKMNETFTDLWPDGKPSDLEAVTALKCKTGLLAPVGVVGDALKDGANTVGRGAKQAVGGAVGGFTSALGDISSAFISGNLFGDEANSSHSASTPGSAIKKKDRIPQGHSAGSDTFSNAPTGTPGRVFNFKKTSILGFGGK